MAKIPGNKILVVGGCGYLGGLIVDKLVADDYDVTIYDNLTYEERFLKPVKFIYGDVEDTDEISQVANQFDKVIWLAALVGDPACSINPDLSNRINHLAVKNFCHKLKKDIKLLFFSTCSVYGMNDDYLNEDSPTNPLSVYAITKLAAEKHVLDINGTVFRLGTLYGIGDHFSRLRLDLVVNVMTLKAFYDKKITVNGGGQWRPIISVSDVAEYTLRWAESFREGVYVLYEKNVQIDELGHDVAKIIHGTLVEHNDLPFQDLRNYKMDSDRAKYAFGYTCQGTVEQEVMKMYSVLSEGRIKNPYSPVYHNGNYLKDKLI